MVGAIRALFDPKTLSLGLDQLCGIPGLRLVMATKIYRFCCPEIGAAVDLAQGLPSRGVVSLQFIEKEAPNLPLLKQIADYLKVAYYSHN
jgi:hypothetical protein